MFNSWNSKQNQAIAYNYSNDISKANYATIELNGEFKKKKEDKINTPHNFGIAS